VISFLIQTVETSTEIDCEKHLLNHTERAKKTLSRQALQEVCKPYQAEFSTFIDRELMGIARHHNYINVWKQKITRWVFGDIVSCSRRKSVSCW